MMHQKLNVDFCKFQVLKLRMGCKFHDTVVWHHYIDMQCYLLDELNACELLGTLDLLPTHRAN